MSFCLRFYLSVFRIGKQVQCVTHVVENYLVDICIELCTKQQRYTNNILITYERIKRNSFGNREVTA